MSVYAWRYVLPDGRKGTLIAPDLETVEQARAEMARLYGCQPEEVNVQRVGEDYASAS